MMASNTTGRIYVAVSNIYDAQQNPIVIQPPVYCTLKRYSRYNVTLNRPSITREFDIVINVEGLQNGIVLTLTALPKADVRYGLSIKATDAHGFLFANNRPVMLTTRGQVNENLLSDFNMRVPTTQVQNNALYFIPNVGTD